MKIGNKMAIVTGSGRGIGKAIALRLAEEGASIVIADIDLDEGEKVVQMIKGKGREALAVKCDVTNIQGVENMVEKTMKKFGRIDILVNNAGVSSIIPFTQLQEKDWDYNMDINAKGQFLVSKTVVPHMIRQKYGRIINNGSLASKQGARYLAHYAASKFGVVGLTYTMALELASYNITVNAVCPGLVLTDMIKREWKWEADLRGMTPEEVRKEYLAGIPMGRFCRPEDIAGLVAFLASEDADHITGQAINVNGGMEHH